MPLNITPKATSANSNTPSKVVTRQEVSVAKPSASTARVQALKARLSGQTPSQPVAPRPTRTSSRQEEFAKLQKFGTPTPPAPAKTLSRTSARQEPEDFTKIPPPPSGLAPGQEEAPVDNIVEAPQPAPVATKEQSDPQFVALARKERQLRKAQQEFKAAQDAWKQDQAKYIPKERLTSETLKVLAEAGITPDKLVELQINQASPDPNQALLDRIQQLEEQIKGVTDPETGALAQRDKEAYDLAVKQIHSDVDLLVESNPDFGTIKSEGKTADVVELITSVFDTEGIILDVEEAAKLVEDKLADRLYKQYERISQYEKIKAKLGKQTETSAEANTAQQRQQTQQATTLTNAGASQRPLSPRDRAILKVQEALDRAKGK